MRVPVRVMITGFGRIVRVNLGRISVHGGFPHEIMTGDKWVDAKHREVCAAIGANITIVGDEPRRAARLALGHLELLAPVGHVPNHGVRMEGRLMTTIHTYT